MVSPLPDTNIANRNASDDSECAGNPVVLATGNKVEYEVDFQTELDDGLSLTRTYNHYSQERGIFGPHWRSNHDYQLKYSNYDAGACVDIGLGILDCDKKKARTIDAHRPDGKVIRYNRNSAGQYRAADAGSSTFMQWNAAGNLVYHAQDGEIEEYGKEVLGVDWISRRTNRHGESWTYEGSMWMVSRITHSSGRRISFTWDPNTLLINTITDPNGKVHQYQSRPYAGSVEAILTGYSQADTGLSVTYHYENASFRDALTGKSYNGVRYSTFAYDANGRVESTQHAGGVDKYQFTYLAGSGSDDNGSYTTFNTTVTNPLGKKEVHRHRNGRPIGVQGTASTYCPATATSITYDTNKHVDKKTDANGIVTDFDYDAKGRLVKKVEAFGRPEARTISYVWDANIDRLNSMTVAGEVRVEYTYGTDNRVSRMRTVNLSANGVAGQVRDFTYTYTKHSNGLVNLMTIDGPIPGTGDAIKRSFSAAGYLLWTENSLGHRTTYSAHNGLGQPGRMVSPNGATTDFVYDALGRLYTKRELRNGVWADTQFRYTPTGRIASETDPSGSSLIYEYTAALRLIRMYRDAPGVLDGGGTREERSFTYNAAGNIIGITDKLDAAIKARSYFDFDELGRLRATRGNNGQIKSFTYDLGGRLETVVDAANRVKRFTYDGIGRVATERDRLNGLTQYSYDASDRITKVIDPRNVVTNYRYDGFGDLWLHQSPDAGSTSFTYSAGGLRATMTRGNGVQTVFTHDTLGRLTNIAAGGQNQTVVWDTCTNGKSLTCSITDPHGELSYVYSPFGEVTSRAQRIGTSGISFGHSYTYDNQGRLTGIGYPGSVAVGYAYAHGRLSAMTARVAGTNQNVATGMRYLPFGSQTTWTYGNGLTRAYGYDQGYVAGDARLTSVATKNGTSNLQSLVLNYNTHNEVSKITNQVVANMTRDFTYDGVGRLLRASLASNSYDSYAYDANGNRTSTGSVSPGVLGVPQTYQTAANSNRLMAIRGTAYSYDGNGNTLNDGRNSYSYNPFNRLTRVVNDEGTHDYWINALGQRTWKRVGGSGGPSYGFTYGPDGQVDTEYAWTTSKWSHYLRLPGGEPIALARNGQLHMIHTDQLGRPEVVTNSAKAVVWRSNNFAFSRIVTLNNVGDLNIGLPGQYEDGESGNNYNGFRTYNWRTGRYLESDPIGLSAGLNTYAYVGGNPISFSDPLGLAKVDLGEGFTGRVDLFNYGGNASFEIHVYNGKGTEVGVYGPDGWINKHGHKGAPNGLPKGVLKQCETVAADYSRRTGISARRAAQGASRLKSFFKGWPLMGGMIEATSPSPQRVCDEVPDYPGCEAL